MARLSDLGCELSIAGPLFLLGVLSAEGDHAPREAGQVSHLVVQNPPTPLSKIRQPPGGHVQQVGLYCLGARWELGRERGVGGMEKGGGGQKMNILETAANTALLSPPSQVKEAH